MILERIAGSRFSRVLRTWEGETVALFGGGPSLTREQIAEVEGRAKAIAINHAYLWAPWAEAHYAADSHWHRWHTEGIGKPLIGMKAAEVKVCWGAFGGEKCSIQNSGANIEDPAVHILRNKTFPDHSIGLSLDPEALVTGRNSGFQALNLAILAGAARVILLGFDAQPDRDGKSHFFGEHPKATSSQAYPEYMRAFSAAERPIKAAGVEVLNCSPGSAINSFPKVALGDALARRA